MTHTLCYDLVDSTHNEWHSRDEGSVRLRIRRVPGRFPGASAGVERYLCGSRPTAWLAQPGQVPSSRPAAYANICHESIHVLSWVVEGNGESIAMTQSTTPPTVLTAALALLDAATGALALKRHQAQCVRLFRGVNSTLVMKVTCSRTGYTAMARTASATALHVVDSSTVRDATGSSLQVA